MDDVEIKEHEKGLHIESDKSLPDIKFVDSGKIVEVFDDSFYIPYSYFTGNLIFMSSPKNHIGIYGDDRYEFPLDIILPDSLVSDDIKIELNPMMENKDSEIITLDSEKLEKKGNHISINGLLKGLLYDIKIISNGYQTELIHINQEYKNPLDLKSFIEKNIKIEFPDFINSGVILFSRGFEEHVKEIDKESKKYNLSDYFLEHVSITINQILEAEEKFNETTVTIMPENYAPSQKICKGENTMEFSNFEELSQVNIEHPDFVESISNSFYKDMEVNVEREKDNDFYQTKGFNDRYNILEDGVVKKVIPGEMDIWISTLAFSIDIKGSKEVRPGEKINKEIDLLYPNYLKVEYYIDSDEDLDSILLKIDNSDIFESVNYKLSNNEQNDICLELKDNSDNSILESDSKLKYKFINLRTGEEIFFRISPINLLFQSPLYVSF